MAVIPGNRPEGKYLFQDAAIRDIIQQRHGRLAEDVERLPADQILRSNLDDLAVELSDPHRFTVPEVHDDQVTMSAPEEASVTVPLRTRGGTTQRPATAVTFSVPYSGDLSVFLYRAAQSYFGNAPIANVGQSSLEFTYTLVDPKPENLKKWFEQELILIREALEWSRTDIEPYNKALPGQALKLLNARKDRLRKNADLAERLGYPLQRRDDAPTTYVVPAKRRRVKVEHAPSTASTKPSKLEPALLDDDYAEIIEALQEIARVMEYSPHAFRTMDEEDLRWLFLIPLNIAFTGEATGETFNYEGKTDILIRAEGRTVFIAECLIWKGQAYLSKKVDQLHGYASWRDTKTALLVFNRNKNFSQVLDKIVPTIESHPQFVRTVRSDEETVFRFVLSHRDDPERELSLAVLCFDVPSD